MPPARRRRAQRLLTPLNADERADFVSRIALRTTPSFDFFLFSLLSGVILSTGLLLDQPALLILGAVLAPLMAPVIGTALGTVLGSVRYFVRSLFALLLGSLLVFLVGSGGGHGDGHAGAILAAGKHGAGSSERSAFLGELFSTGTRRHLHHHGDGA